MRWGWLAALLTSCATGSIPRVPGEPAPAVASMADERAYRDVLDRNTRQASLYDFLDTRMFIRAAWRSDPLAVAQVRRTASFSALPAAEVDRALADERARLEGATEFFVGVSAPDYRHEDFEKSGSMWRVVLVVGERELSPTAIRRLGRTSTAMQAMYPFMEVFWVGYLFTFPPVELGPGQSMTLRLASAIGRADLTFERE